MHIKRQFKWFGITYTILNVSLQWKLFSFQLLSEFTLIKLMVYLSDSAELNKKATTTTTIGAATTAETISTALLKAEQKRISTKLKTTTAYSSNFERSFIVSMSKSYLSLHKCVYCFQCCFCSSLHTVFFLSSVCRWCIYMQSAACVSVWYARYFYIATHK